MTLPAHVLAWDEDAQAELAERTALVADGCRLPFGSARAETLAEGIVRAWDANGRDRWVARLPAPSAPD